MSREQTNPATKWRSPVPRSTYRGSTPPEQTAHVGKGRGGGVSDATVSVRGQCFCSSNTRSEWKCEGEGAPAGVVFFILTAFSRDEDDMTVCASSHA